MRRKENLLSRLGVKAITFNRCKKIDKNVMAYTGGTLSYYTPYYGIYNKNFILEDCGSIKIGNTNLSVPYNDKIYVYCPSSHDNITKNDLKVRKRIPMKGDDPLVLKYNPVETLIFNNGQDADPCFVIMHQEKNGNDHQFVYATHDLQIQIEPTDDPDIVNQRANVLLKYLTPEEIKVAEKTLAEMNEIIEQRKERKKPKGVKTEEKIEEVSSLGGIEMYRTRAIVLKEQEEEKKVKKTSEKKKIAKPIEVEEIEEEGEEGEEKEEKQIEIVKPETSSPAKPVKKVTNKETQRTKALAEDILGELGKAIIAKKETEEKKSKKNITEDML